MHLPAHCLNCTTPSSPRITSRRGILRGTTKPLLNPLSPRFIPPTLEGATLESYNLSTALLIKGVVKHKLLSSGQDECSSDGAHHGGEHGNSTGCLKACGTPHKKQSALSKLHAVQGSSHSGIRDSSNMLCGVSGKRVQGLGFRV